MTSPGDDPQKKKADDAAKYLAESFFGLNMTPADVGGEVLFDDYDDPKSQSASLFAQLDPQDTGVASPSDFQSVSSNDLRAAASTSPEDSFEENLDDLIVFSDEDEDEDVSVVVAARDDEEDENFDFGDEDDDEDDDDLDEDDDEFDDDEDDDDDLDEDDEDDEEDDEDDFGAEIDGPQKRRGSVSLPQARSEQSGQSHDVSHRTSQDRSSTARGRAPQPSAHKTEDRDRSRPERSRGDSERGSSHRAGRGSARSESQREVPAEQSARSMQKKSSPVEPVGNDDDTYWQELDRWVWEDKDPRKKITAAVAPDELDEEEDIDEDDIVVTGTGPGSSEEDDEETDDQPKKRRRGRRRGGRGRGGRQADRSRPSADADESAPVAAGRYVDDDLSEILFEEDQEDIVSVSAGSVQAQRRIREEPPAPPVRKSEPEAVEEDEPGDDERGSDDRPSGRRGRRGRRGRGRSSDTPPEAARGSERQTQPTRRPVRDEVDDAFEDDDEFLNVDARETGFEDAEEPVPRPERGRRPQPERGRGRHRDEPRERTSSESREPRERETSSSESDRPTRRAGSRERVSSREPEGDRQSSREPRVAPEFRDIPTWEEAIACLSLRTPTEDHARRTENRGRGNRDSGRPPRRR